MEMHVQDFAKIMRRAWAEAEGEYRKAKIVSTTRHADDLRAMASVVVLLGLIANAAEQYAREPCAKCGYPGTGPCQFPGHIQCVKPLTENQEAKK